MLYMSSQIRVKLEMFLWSLKNLCAFSIFPLDKSTPVTLQPASKNGFILPPSPHPISNTEVILLIGVISSMNGITYFSVV